MKRDLPPLNALRAFEAAARLGRMSAAAQELAVTPGAISRQVAHLEECLGLKLFAGSKTKPILTVAGESLLPGLTSGLDLIADAVRLVRKQEASTLDVSCLGSFTLRWLIPRLHRFQESHPDLTVRLNTTSEAIDIEKTIFDVAITIDEGATVLEGDITLFEEELGPVGAPIRAGGLRWDTVGAVARLSSRTRPDAWQLWSSLAGLDLPEAPITDYQHYYYALEAAVSGLGVVIAPRHLVTEDLALGKLVAPLGFISSGYRYVAKRHSRASQGAQAFCQWLRQEAAH